MQERDHGEPRNLNSKEFIRNLNSLLEMIRVIDRF